MITDEDIKPDPAKLGVIKKFPTLIDLTMLCSFLGLPNQLGSFYSDLAHMTAVLRPLLKKSVDYQSMKNLVRQSKTSPQMQQCTSMISHCQWNSSQMQQDSMDWAMH